MFSVGWSILLLLYWRIHFRLLIDIEMTNIIWPWTRLKTLVSELLNKTSIQEIFADFFFRSLCSYFHISIFKSFSLNWIFKLICILALWINQTHFCALSATLIYYLGTGEIVTQWKDFSEGSSGNARNLTVDWANTTSPASSRRLFCYPINSIRLKTKTIKSLLDACAIRTRS